MRFFTVVQFFVSLFFSHIALAAGGWSSGGGGLLKDTVNPWFLSNTPRVNYCILMDQKNFGASQDLARLQVTRAIQFWQQQFAHAVLPTFAKFGRLQIASQVFSETPCHDDTDIVFQFGVLNQKQRMSLKNPTDYAAITVRTNYDEINLRGKGFVYISPSSGPLAYNSEGVAEDAWRIRNGQILYLTLVHEMGHIFGLQHSGSLGDLMSPGFVESILAYTTNTKGTLPEQFNFFSLPKASPVACPSARVHNIWQMYFGAQASDKCFRFVFVHDSRNELFGKTTMKVYAASSPSDVFREIHDIQLSMDRFFPSYMSLIWLPKPQKVFDESDLRDELNSRMIGISRFMVSKQGQFTLSDGESARSLSVRFEQGRPNFFIDGVVDGKSVPLL